MIYEIFFWKKPGKTQKNMGVIIWIFFVCSGLVGIVALNTSTTKDTQTVLFLGFFHNAVPFSRYLSGFFVKQISGQNLFTPKNTMFVSSKPLSIHVWKSQLNIRSTFLTNKIQNLSVNVAIHLHEGKQRCLNFISSTGEPVFRQDRISKSRSVIMLNCIPFSYW